MAPGCRRRVVPMSRPPTTGSARSVPPRCGCKTWSMGGIARPWRPGRQSRGSPRRQRWTTRLAQSAQRPHRCRRPRAAPPQRQRPFGRRRLRVPRRRGCGLTRISGCRRIRGDESRCWPLQAVHRHRPRQRHRRDRGRHERSATPIRHVPLEIADQRSRVEPGVAVIEEAVVNAGHRAASGRHERTGCRFPSIGAACAETTRFTSIPAVRARPGGPTVDTHALHGSRAIEQRRHTRRDHFVAEAPVSPSAFTPRSAWRAPLRRRRCTPPA